MNVKIVTTPLADVRADAVVVGLHAETRSLPPALAAVDTRLGGQVKAVLDAERFQAKVGQVTHVHAVGRVPAPRVVVVGLGPQGELSLEAVRRAASSGVRRARELGARTVAVEPLGARLAQGERGQAVVEGALLGTYVFDRYKREKADRAIEELRLAASDARTAHELSQGARRGETVARATWFARDLVNAPANEVHPAHLARVATQVAREGRLRVRVYDRAGCARLGMGAFLGVAAGSAQPPRFIHLTYTPVGRPRRRVAVVGKGVTFDSGGLDLKTADGMLRMKYDMSGGAAVLAVLRALPALAPDVEVHGLVAATENMPSGSALRPGDVLRAMNGTTIEIGNTDAEGRLTLADALGYAVRHVKADEIIDMATLTGACVVALGPLCAGLMSNSPAMTERFMAAAERAGERVWQLPVIDEYREHLKSDVADLNNVGPRNGGAINAAIFLREFVGDTPWIHLDIAGPAFTEKDLPLAPKGATGATVRTLLAYLTGEAGRAR